MPVTGVRGRQILDDSVVRADINTTSSGNALITKVLVGAGLLISGYTGADSGTGDVTLTLANSGVTAGSYGSGSLVPVITVDAFGRITSISTAAISGGGTTLNGTGFVRMDGTTVSYISGTSSQFVKADGTLDSTSYASLAGATFTGQIVSTRANNTSDGAGQIFLNGANGNRIDWAAAGLGAPTFTTRSVGTKLVLFPALGASLVDYAIGMESTAMWFSTVSTSGLFKFYGGTTLGASLTGAGALTLSSTLTATQIIRTGGTSAQFLKADGSVDSSVYLTANQSISITGDATGSGTTAITLTLANSGVTPGTYNNVTVNAKGLITAGSNVSYLTANQSISLSGDATGSGTTAIAVTLANSGVGAGTYRSVTVNAKGLVTAGTNPTTLSGYGITDALSTSGGTMSGTLIFANASSPNTHTIQFGDNTGWTLRFMTNVSGTPTARFSFGDNGTLSATGQYITTRAWQAADGAGQIFLNGTGGNRIDWVAGGVAAPSYTTRSVGTKLVLYPSVNASQVDYGFGIESDTLWASVAVNGGSFKWYGGTQLNMQLSGRDLLVGSGVGVGAGRLTVGAAAGGTSLYLTDATNSTLFVTHTGGGRTNFFNGTATQWLMEVGGSVTIGNSTSAPSKLFLFNTNDGIPDYQITHQSSGTTLNTSSPIILTNLYNSGGNGHNLYVTSTSASGLWEYNITKTWGGILTLGASTAGTTVVRHLYIYDSGQIRLANYTTTSSFSGTAVGVLAFTSDGSIIPIPTPGGGSGITGSGTSNYITKFTGGTTIGNSVIYELSSQISIGTTTSDAKLRVAGSFNGTQAIFSQVDGRGLEIATSLQAGTNDAGSILNARGAGSGVLIIQTDGVEQARFARNGDYGFGTNSPTNLANYRTLQLQGGGSGARIMFSDSTGTNRGTVYGSTAETAINASAQFNLYVDNTNILNASTTTIDVLSTNGFAIGNKTNRRRVQYDSGSFSILNDGNGYANLIGGTINPQSAGAQLRISGGGTEAGIYMSSANNLLFVTDWATGSNGVVVDVVGGFTRVRASSVNGSYLQLQRSTSTDYGYVGNSFHLFGAGFNSNTDLGIRSEGAINFGTGSTATMRLQTSGQLRLPSYTATTSFNGTTLVGYLGFDSSGNILTAAAPGGSSQWTTSGANIYYAGGNVGIGGSFFRLRTEISAAAADPTVLSNDVSAGNLLLSDAGNNVVAMGINTGKAWLQARNYLGAQNTPHDFYINPLGGKVIVGSNTSDGVGHLQLNGTMSFRTSATTIIPAVRFLPKNSLITSTSQGDLETDNNGLLYYSYAATDRGIMETSHYLALNSTYTLTNNTTAQRIFNTGTNGAVAVEALAYEFEMRLYITNMATGSNHALTIGFVVGSGASINSIGYTAIAGKGTVTSAGTAQATTVSTANQTAITSSNTGSAAHAIVKGIVRFSAAGTFAPRITLGVASAAVVQTNSYFKLTPFGGSNTTSVGNVS